MMRILLWLLLLPSVLLAEIRLSDKTRVTVLTCGTGNELYSLFGHTALRISDPLSGLDVVYNYGAFDFAAPNFVGRFTKGDLQYFVATDSYNGFLEQYRYEGRSVVEQELFIPLEKKQQLFDELLVVLNSDARYYTYKFIDRNCTNMTMQLINKVLGGEVLHKTGDTSITYREIIYPYFDGHFFEQLGTSIIFGTRVDEDSRMLFLPTELEQSLASAVYQGQPLSEKANLVLDAPPTGKPFSIVNNIYVYLLILLAVAFVNKRWLTSAYLIVIGLIGVFFCIAGWYSLHVELKWNYNALLCNPLLLALAIGMLTGRQKLIKISAWIGVGCLVIYTAYMIGKIHLAVVSPMILLHALIFWRALRK